VYVALASERSYLSLHLMSVYGSPALAKRLKTASRPREEARHGQSLRALSAADDLALDAVGEIVAAVPMEKWIAIAKAARR
jgi:hypothetical protein